jgi:hypothetical protein
MPFASRAVSRSGNLIVAIMTPERAFPEMVGQRDAAVGALERQAAVRAQDEVGEPPAVEKKKALLLLFDIFLKGGSELFRKETFLLPDIQDLDVGEGSAFNPFGERQELELAGPGVLVRFEGRRCRTQDQGGFHLPGSDDGQVPCMILELFFLLVRGIMFLIHDDDPEFLTGSKDG